MSEKKTATKNKKNNKEAPEKKIKKDNEKTTEVADKKINTDEVTPSEKVDKDKPKSASQSSISHFYRASIEG